MVQFRTEGILMTIPPVGTPIGAIISPDEPANGKPVRQDPQRPASSPTSRADSPEMVEISTEAQMLRDKQADITRLQTLEHAAQAVKDSAAEVKDKLANLDTAEKSGDKIKAESIKQEIQDRINEIDARKRAATFNNEQLLSDRDLVVKSKSGEERIQVAAASKEIDKFTQDTRRAVESKDRHTTANAFSELSRVQQHSRETRARIEKDVRDSVEHAVRESSKPQVRDVRDAERLLNESRRQTQAPKSGNMEQISQKAVNLLQ